MSDCPFCDTNHRIILQWGDLVYATPDNYPVTPGHFLVIPKRHVPSVHQLTRDELAEMLDIVTAFEWLHDFNMGFNSGKVAGQTVEHVHMHVIPRREGDVEDPTGGIRNVIPGRGRYGTS